MPYFVIKEDKAAGYTGFIDAAHKWGLPGIRKCPGCSATWSSGFAYPSVDLTPIATVADFETARAEPIEEYERLRELIHPLVPPDMVLEPGATFGPLVGRAQGRFGSLYIYLWILLVRREALEKLQAEGLRGLKGCRTELRWRQRNSPDFLELEVRPAGRMHLDSLPTTPSPPCPRCGRIRRPPYDDILLDARTLPEDLDLFQLADYGAVLCTERFVDACHRLNLDGITFRQVPVK